MRYTFAAYNMPMMASWNPLPLTQSSPRHFLNVQDADYTVTALEDIYEYIGNLSSVNGLTLTVSARVLEHKKYNELMDQFWELMETLITKSNWMIVFEGCVKVHQKNKADLLYQIKAGFFVVDEEYLEGLNELDWTKDEVLIDCDKDQQVSFDIVEDLCHHLLYEPEQLD